ncbi:MAG: hypothetical protein HN909_03260 [Phycisphaerales bacterium]|jgi:hypothetical protein|nr:hypothetical protein [Phycisphaerales bacterium]
MSTTITIPKVEKILWTQGLVQAEAAIEDAYRSVYRRLDYLTLLSDRTEVEESEYSLLHMTVVGYASYLTRAMETLQSQHPARYEEVLCQVG